MMVIASLNSSADSHDFKEPVKWKELGLDDYPTIIKRPRDLVKSKKFKKHPQARIAKECGRYNSVLEFFNDIEQIWQNCITYNDVSSEIAHSALRMRAMGRTRKNTWIQKMAPELVKDGDSSSVAVKTTVTPSTSSEEIELGNGEKRKRSHEKGKIKGKDGNDDKRKKKSKTGGGKSRKTQSNNNTDNRLFSDEDDGKNKNKKGNMNSTDALSSNSDDTIIKGRKDWTISPKDDEIEHLGRRISKLHDHHLTEVVKFMYLTGIDEVIKIKGAEDEKSSIILNLDALSPHLFWALDTMVSAQLSRQARSKTLKLLRERDDTLSPVS
ncbi:hypothetical protein FOL47_008444 [Perkinsus chesapeaki]|uniref:Bromo domain-containing protein n=1 Tax=Perkinsus chesapeaki TaxID=330153 RepID=A0A7J6LDZ6_PERCH|nr:hypothetical protein FOL47_008444 [Perkinsus chesapeaki]